MYVVGRDADVQLLACEKRELGDVLGVDRLGLVGHAPRFEEVVADLAVRALTRVCPRQAFDGRCRDE